MTPKAVASEMDQRNTAASEAEESNWRQEQEQDSLPMMIEALTTTPAEPAGVSLEELRFSKVEAGDNDWCGITTPEADLVCLTDGVAEVAQVRPLLDFGFSQELNVTMLCTVAQDSKLSCNSELLAPPCHLGGGRLFGGMRTGR